jgi:hypothetical protein
VRGGLGNEIEAFEPGYSNSRAHEIETLDRRDVAWQRAEAVVFDLSWIGTSGYSLQGQLTFADSLLGTGVIHGTQIQDLTINVLLNGVSQGTASLASFDSAIPFNLNFDTTTGQFVVGGVSLGPAGQFLEFQFSYIGRLCFRRWRAISLSRCRS